MLLKNLGQEQVISIIVLGASKVIRRFPTAQQVSDPTPVLFKGQMYDEIITTIRLVNTPLPHILTICFWCAENI